MAGCGSKGSLAGKATYNNTPLPKGSTLTFISASDRSYTTDINSDAGDYKIEGLPVGEYKVVVKPYAAPNIGGQGGAGRIAGGFKGKSVLGPTKDQKDAFVPPADMFDVFNKTDSGGGLRIPAKFLDKDSTTAKVTVKAGKQVDVNILLAD
jgi:hypothetical protein